MVLPDSTDLTTVLHAKLQEVRGTLLSKLDGLSEYDLRRPLVPSGTNLLGLVKHLAGNEYTYLGTSFGRPPTETLAWEEDGTIWDGADMWATPDQTSADLIGLYRRACAHGDATIDALELDAPGRVPHWPAERADTTLGVVLIRMIAETAQHAGHADLLRELIDGTGGSDHDEMGDETLWRSYLTTVQEAADAFAPES